MTSGAGGTIHGAAFVKSPKGHALGFDGVDDFVACAASKSLQQLERAGTIELWFKPTAWDGRDVLYAVADGEPDADAEGEAPAADEGPADAGDSDDDSED